MADRLHKILLVEPDGEVLEILAPSLARRFDAHMTCVDDAVSCLDVELADPHDLVIAEFNLAGTDGLDLAGKLMALSHRPVILLGDDPTCDEVIEAMRLGVCDVFRKPFAVAHLLETADRELRYVDLRRRRVVKYRRMRDLVRRTIQERRNLNHRMELVCRDLVGAHRRLVHRVLAIEGVNSNPST